MLNEAFLAGAMAARHHCDEGTHVHLEERIDLDFTLDERGIEVRVEFNDEVDVQTTLGRCLRDVSEDDFALWAQNGWDRYYDGPADKGLGELMKLIQQSPTTL